MRRRADIARTKGRVPQGRCRQSLRSVLRSVSGHDATDLGTSDAPLIDRLLRLPTRIAFLAGLSLYPAIMVLLATRRGPGISPDSVVYVSAARNFAHRGEMVDFLGLPLTLWPPGLPWLLSVFERAGIDSQTAAVGINVVSASLTVLLTYALAKATLGSPTLALVAATVVSTSASTVRVYSMLWTEPLFTVLTLSALLLLTSAVRQNRLAAGPLVAVAALVTGATMLRIAGLWLVPIAALGALLAERAKGLARALAWALLAGLLSSAGFFVVVLRNVAAGAPPLGERYAAGLTLKGIVVSSLETLGGYVVPPLFNLHLLVGVPVAGLLLVSVFAVIRQRSAASAIISVFVVLYWVSLWYSQLRTGIDATSERLLAPIFAPMVILVIHGIRTLMDVARASAVGRDQRRIVLTERAVRVGSVTMLLAALLTGIVTGGLFVARARVEGLGYNRVDGIASPLAQAVKALPPEAGVAADDYPKMYWISGRTSITVIPWIGYHFPPAKAAREDDILVERIRSGNVSYLADFDDLPTVMTPQDLNDLGCDAILVEDFPDGSLWRVSTCA